MRAATAPLGGPGADVPNAAACPPPALRTLADLAPVRAKASGERHGALAPGHLDKLTEREGAAAVAPTTSPALYAVAAVAAVRSRPPGGGRGPAAVVLREASPARAHGCGRGVGTRPAGTEQPVPPPSPPQPGVAPRRQESS